MVAICLVLSEFHRLRRPRHIGCHMVLTKGAVEELSEHGVVGQKQDAMLTPVIKSFIPHLGQVRSFQSMHFLVYTRQLLDDRRVFQVRERKPGHGTCRKVEQVPITFRTQTNRYSAAWAMARAKIAIATSLSVSAINSELKA